MGKKVLVTRSITQTEAELCAAEPIHHIGSIQPHGFQLILDPQNYLVVQYSENTIQRLNTTLPSHLDENTPIISTPISYWLQFEKTLNINTLSSTHTQKLELTESGYIRSSQWECLAHLSRGWISLEFVPNTDQQFTSHHVIAKMRQMAELLKKVPNTQKLFDTITEQMQHYSNYDRVMMYRYLPDWSGEVVSEAVSSREKIKYLGMRFPAEDIPKQARTLYKKNKIRALIDVSAPPARLIPERLPDNRPLDQSYSLLRNMSDMHRCYLENMHVKSTLSISILKDDHLWGMIVFHHNTPKSPPAHVGAQLKDAFELFTDIISSYIAPALNIELLTQHINTRHYIESTFNQAKSTPISNQLFQSILTQIKKEIHYDFIGIVLNNQCFVTSHDQFKILGHSTVDAIARLFTDQQETSYHSHQLHNDYQAIPGLERMVGLYITHSSMLPDLYVFIGKSEKIQTIKWGGKPHSINIVLKDNRQHLEPRSSFSRWKQQIRGQSEFWEQSDTHILESLFNGCKDFFNFKQNQLLVNQLEKSAYYDNLTNLANRAYLKFFAERIKQTDQTRFLSFIFIDLDNFKDVNDFMGHETGDRLLITVANRLQNCVRPGDLVVRLGGDEFIVVFTHPECPKTTQLATIAKKIVDCINEPMFDKEHTLVVTPSVGIITENCRNLNFNEALKRADIAMYAAKNEGKNRFHIFDHEDQNSFNRKTILTMDLRDYIHKGHIELYYQPQSDYDHHMTGVEALARWHHTQFGAVNPELFIELAEKNNLIYSLGLKIIEQSCIDLARWKKEGLKGNFDTLSINISPSQLVKSSFERDLIHILTKYQIPESSIRLEITESVFMKNYQKAIGTLTRLRDRGITVSLDDFGTGYSSLNSLWKLPIDQVKIDKSFISNMNHDQELFTMVESIINLCKKLHLEVVAEGVENSIEYNILKGLGCDTCQGFYFSKPMQASQFQQEFLHV